MNIKQTILMLFITAISVTGVIALPSVALAAPGDSKAECKKIDGFYEGSGDSATCNADLSQDECDKYGGTFDIGRVGSKLACIIKKGAKPNTGTTCGDYGCDTNQNIEAQADSSGLTGTGNDCGGVKTAIITCDADNTGDKVENNGVWALLLMALNFLTAGVGILAVGGIVYGAVLYTTAEDKADQVKKATDIITNVVIGLVLFALMWAGLNFIVPGGVFA